MGKKENESERKKRKEVHKKCCIRKQMIKFSEESYLMNIKQNGINYYTTQKFL